MTPPEAFERFSERLDQDWIRSRLQATLGDEEGKTEAELLRAIGRADPLADRVSGGWWDALRLALAPWPARLGVGAAIAALLLVGFALGRGLNEGSGLTVAHPVPPMPAYSPATSSGLGVVPMVDPRSQEKFREAMAFHPTPDFAVKALPLLREAVALDATNDAAQFWLGVALLQVNQPHEAVAPLEQAVRLAPADTVYKQYLMFAYLRTGAVKQAMIVLVELMRGRPQ